MTCPTLATGTRFLSTALLNIDCQSRTVGSYGFSALADPGSPASIALAGLITIFVALFGIRFLFGPGPGVRGTVDGVIRIGLVLLLATSWPAWRVLGYELILDGPVELARTIGAATGLPSGNGNLLSRLQNADDGMVVVTMYGSGRLTGGVSAGADLGDSANGIALSDSLALGLARAIFLSSTLGAFAIVRLGAGLLLALAPLMAGLALFSESIGIFMGWVRGLVFCALGSLTLFVLQGAQLALLLPWLNDVVSVRESNTLAPSAPTECLVMTSAFALLTVGALLLVARISFFSVGGMAREGALKSVSSLSFSEPIFQGSRTIDLASEPTRAQAISNSIATSLKREQLAAGKYRAGSWYSDTQSQAAYVSTNTRIGREGPASHLHHDAQRNRRRVSGATANRDRVQ